MLSDGPESHPYDSNGKRFVIRTIFNAIAQAQSWDEVMSGCEAMANIMRIAKELDGESPRETSQAVSALNHLKELGREIRENGKSDGATISNAPRMADSATSREHGGKNDGANKT
jgi:hypothetical protein